MEISNANLTHAQCPSAETPSVVHPGPPRWALTLGASSARGVPVPKSNIWGQFYKWAVSNTGRFTRENPIENQ